VLHIDDDEQQLEMMKQFLTIIDPSIKVTGESNPCSALKLLDKTQFDCIVTDYKMPEMTGLELASKIREHRNVPIILYTGQGSEEVAEKAFSIGIDDYIRKEIDPSHFQLLAKRIRVSVEKKRFENLYLKVVEGARDAIAISDGKKIIYANQALAKLLQFDSPEQLIGLNPQDFVEDNLKAFLRKNIDPHLKGDSPPEIREYRLKLKNNIVVDIETSATVIDYNGRKSILVFIRDISNRKAMEINLSKSEERFRNLVEIDPDGVATMDLHGRITYVNESFLKITGFDESEIIGKNFLKLGTLRMSDLPEFVSLFTNFLMNKGKLEKPIEFPFKKKNGSVGTAEAMARLLETKDGKKEVLIVVRDISDRKKNEEDLHQYSKHLEKTIIDRNQELLDSEKLIAIGRAASMAGHDLRGTLNTIQNATYLMKSKPEKTEEMIKIINKSVELSVKMLEEIKEKARESPLDFSEVNFDEYVYETIKGIVNPPNIAFNFMLYSKSKTLIDKYKMNRVLDNLIRNSIDAMPNGGEITIETQANGDDLLLNIHDQGKGIPTSIMKSLFKPFNTSKPDGTGLGLAFCKRVVEAHDGKITAKTQEGLGTEFTIRLKNYGQIMTTPEIYVSQPKGNVADL
jgi:two-component system sporulation sensor kinase A